MINFRSSITTNKAGMYRDIKNLSNPFYRHHSTGRMMVGIGRFKRFSGIGNTIAVFHNNKMIPKIKSISRGKDKLYDDLNEILYLVDGDLKTLTTYIYNLHLKCNNYHMAIKERSTRYRLMKE